MPPPYPSAHMTSYSIVTTLHNLRHTMSDTYTLAALDVPVRSTERADPLRSNSYRWRSLPLSWFSSNRQLSMLVAINLWLGMAGPASWSFCESSLRSYFSYNRSMLRILLMHDFTDARFRAQEVGGELTTHSGHARSNQGLRGIKF